MRHLGQEEDGAIIGGSPGSASGGPICHAEVHKRASGKRVHCTSNSLGCTLICADKHSPDWLRRAVAFAWETALSRSDLSRLTWSEIDLSEDIIELKNGRGKTGKPQALPIHSAELEALIVEFQNERSRVPNAAGLVLTIDGQPISKLKFEYAFRRAVRLAGIKNFVEHDLRHCAISRWATAGVPTATAMLAAGHSSVASHKRYQNLTKTDLKAAFGVVTEARNVSKKSKQSR